jgi:hypothetical protein
MNNTEFIEAVREMRTLQIRYFKDQNIANALAHADALLSALKGGDK